MGRSRAASHPPHDHSNQRSKKKRIALNVENSETLPTGGQRIIDSRVSLYHCNYCNKDISGKIHIKCVVCQDFDLCIECFSVGAEVTPHKSNHPYRIMDNLSFPLICPDWNADEEMSLLEGLEMYGFGNWNEVADYVGTKSKSQCIEHYNAVYMNSPCFPLPDLSHVVGKSREELLAMTKGHEVKKESPLTEELTLKEEPLLPDGINYEESRKPEITNQTMPRLTSACDKAYSAIKKASNVSQNSHGVEVEESQADRSIGGKKPKLSGEDKPSMTELSGYNFKREEFEIEYDNDAELVLADLEFKDMDTDTEREMKLHVLRIYSKRLDERKRRKNFILERDLLYPDPFEKSLLPEELQICQRYKVFMRFHPKEVHQELQRNVIEEHRLVKRIQDLQKARIAGCVTATEAYQFIEQQRTKEAELSACKESGQIGTSAKTLQRPNNLKGELDVSPQGFQKGTTALRGAVAKHSPTAIQAITRSLEEWDISGFAGAELLSESEKKLCNEIRILPSHYLNMLQTMSLEISKGNVTKKSDLHTLFKVDPNKVDRVYDMLVTKGVVQAL